MHITGANGQIVTIYNLAGVAVKSFRIEGMTSALNLRLADGIYIIKVGNYLYAKILRKALMYYRGLRMPFNFNHESEALSYFVTYHFVAV